MLDTSLSLVSTYKDIANRKKKRKRSPTVGSTAEAKRAHTGYTLFVHENYESIKGRHLSSAQRGVINEKEVNSTLAKRWGQIDDIEKQSWQERADRLNRAQVSEKHPTSVDLEHPEGTDIFETVALCDPHLTEAETASQNNEESNARKVTRK